MAIDANSDIVIAPSLKLRQVQLVLGYVGRLGTVNPTPFVGVDLKMTGCLVYIELVDIHSSQHCCVVRTISTKT